jgi:predicted Zn-dependent protease
MASPTPYLQVADFLRQVGHAQAALPFLDDARALYPGAPQLHLRYGLIHAAANDTAKALPELEAALAEEPDHPVIQYEAAIQYANANRYDKARPLMERSLARRGDRPAGWALLGKIAWSEGRQQPALDHFTRAVELEPLNQPYRLSRARILYALRRYTEAESDFKTLLTAGFSDPVIYRDLAACSAAQSHWSEARDYVARGLAIAPQNRDLLQIQQQITTAGGDL